MDIEYVAQIAMKVIAFSGVAKSTYMEALQEYKKGNWDKGDEMMAQGQESALIAHQTHQELISKEMQEQQSQATMLLMHAEDQLMSAETIKILVEEMKALYQKVL